MFQIVPSLIGIKNNELLQWISANLQWLTRNETVITAIAGPVQIIKSERFEVNRKM